VRILVDMTAPAHPIVFRPVLRVLREQGHDVHVTARDYAQTLELLRRQGIEHTAIGAHGGARRLSKASALASRTSALTRIAGRGFDLALAHGSNDLALAAAARRIPAVNMFDYEWATQQHNIGCRLARRVVTPDSIPPERLARVGAHAGKLVQFPGLKEEYYLSDFEPDETVLDELGVDRDCVLVVLRPPPDVSLYHRKSNPLFHQVLLHVSGHEDVQAVVLPRTARQRADLQALRLPGIIVAERAVDAQSLIALADLVVSAGGTMNREAVALGTPVFTTFEGRLGAVDEALLADGRLRRLTDPGELMLEKRSGPDQQRIRRDPRTLVELLTSPVR
jgi:predicted glycosyltransferase